MPDNPSDRLKQFEAALDPNITKFAKREHAEPPIAAIIASVREHAESLLKLCDQMDKIVSSSEGDARKAADILISMAARIK